MTSHDRPNILLIHADQHRFDCVGAHGHPLVKTPHLDRLCREGVDFTHAFTPCPICSPARASLLNGQWPTRHGCVSIPYTEVYRPADTPTDQLIPVRLKRAGYRVAHVGKWHGETTDPPEAWGIDHYTPEERGYQEWREAQGLPPRQRRNGWFGEVDPHITPEQHRLAWGAGVTIECVERFHEQGGPFFVRWDPSEPHLPNLIPPGDEAMYPPESIEPWASFPDALAGKPWVQREQRRRWGVDGWAWEDWAPVVSRYLAEITRLDEQVGRLLDTLDRLGLSENTLVVYTADHGDLCGGHGMMDKHFVMYDDVVRAPLIARWPGGLPMGQTCDDMSAHELDLATTLCHVGGVDPPRDAFGRSLVDVAAGRTPPRDLAFSQYFGCQFGLFSQRMARGRRWKYVWNATAEDEFYDLDADPAELVNCAASPDPDAASALAEHHDRLIDWMRSIDDPMCNDFVLGRAAASSTTDAN